MARKKTSNKEKELKGTDQPVRKMGKIKSDDRIPKPSTSLTDQEQVAYNAIALHLLDAEAIRDIDAGILTRYAKSVCRLARFEKQLEEMEVEGIQTFQTGARQISPEYTLMEKEMKIYLGLCDLLGVGPKSREKIVAFQEDIDEGMPDPFFNPNASTDA